MKNIYNIILSLAVLVLAASCDLTESPKANADKSMVFGSESGLQVYTYSFYNYLPSRTSAFQLDAMADYGAKNSLSTYETGSYTTETSTSWDWSGIRNVNYFINNNTDENVSETVRNNYTE
jgi:hypothetical protein